MSDKEPLVPDYIKSGTLSAVPFVVYESAMEKADRQHRRLIAIIIVLISLLFVANVLWLIAWNSYDYVDDCSVELDAGDGGTANYIGNNGDIYNGTDNGTQKAEQDT